MLILNIKQVEDVDANVYIDSNFNLNFYVHFGKIITECSRVDFLTSEKDRKFYRKFDERKRNIKTRKEDKT